MNELTANVNWLGVGVGTIVAFIVGAVWFSPKVFGAKWLEGVGVKMEPNASMPMAAMLAQFIGTFLLSWVVGITAVSNALFTIILIAITIMALVIANGLFIKKSAYAIVVEAGFIAAMVVIMIIAQGVTSSMRA
jgi:Protein of unknown function (DUF1761)